MKSLIFYLASLFNLNKKSIPSKPTFSTFLTVLIVSAESDEEEFFECTSEEPTNEDDFVTRTQLKAKYLLWNKPAGRLVKHPSLK